MHATRFSRTYRESPHRYIYVIGVPGCPVVKVGVADCPRRRALDLRLSTERTLVPSDVDRVQLVVLHQEPGGRGLELALHGRLAHRRVLGEWFDLGPIAVPFVKSLIRELRS